MTCAHIWDGRAAHDWDQTLLASVMSCRQAVNEVLVELHGAEDAGVVAIMSREVERSRQYHAEELDALGSWSGEALVSGRPRVLRLPVSFADPRDPLASCFTTRALTACGPRQGAIRQAPSVMCTDSQGMFGCLEAEAPQAEALLMVLVFCGAGVAAEGSAGLAVAPDQAVHAGKVRSKATPLPPPAGRPGCCLTSDVPATCGRCSAPHKQPVMAGCQDTGGGGVVVTR